MIFFSGYVKNLMDFLFEEVLLYPEKYRAIIDQVQIPPPLCDKYKKPIKERAIQTKSSRFNVN